MTGAGNYLQARLLADAEYREAYFQTRVEASIGQNRDSNGELCCGTPAWRGHMCLYHQGLEDGIEIAVTALIKEEPE